MIFFHDLLSWAFWRSFFVSLRGYFSRPRRFGAFIEWARLVQPGTAEIMFGAYARMPTDRAIKAAITTRQAAARAGFTTDSAGDHREWLRAQNVLHAAIDAGLIPASTLDGLLSGR